MANPHPNQTGLKRTAGPGRPKGSKNRLTKEITRFFESKEYAASATHRMTEGKAPHLETYWLNLLVGKPVDRHELGGPDGGPIVVKFLEVDA